MSAQYSVLVSHVLMRFCFWLREISYARYHTREIYGKVKDGFLAKASLSWHELRYHGTSFVIMARASLSWHELRYHGTSFGIMARASLSWHELRYHGTLSALMFINKREACLIVLFLRE